MPMRTVVPTAAFLAAAALPRPAASQTDADAVKAALRGAASVEVRETELSAGAKQKLAAALGDLFKADADGKPALGVAKDLPNPLEDPEKLDPAYAAAAAAGKARVVVVAFSDPSANNRLTVADVKVLAPDGLPERLKLFVARLRWRYPGACAYEPLPAFEALRKAAESGADAASRQNKVLLDIVRAMQVMDDDVQVLKRKSAAPDEAGAAAADLLKKYQETHTLYPQTGFVFKGSPEEQQKQVQILAVQNEKGLDEAESLKAAADAKDLPKVQRKAATLSCSKCHGIVEKPFQQARAERKIGDGFFLPGHDLPPLKPEDEGLGMDIASAVRKALLIIDQAAK